MTHAPCKIFATAALIAAAWLTLPLHQASAEKRPGHDRLKEAVTLLLQAEKTPNPILLLTHAKQEVEGTLVPRHDRQHEKAIKAIDHAIEVALNDGKRKKAIEKAIEAVRALNGQPTKK